jgi:hypothetical protein
VGLYIDTWMVSHLKIIVNVCINIWYIYPPFPIFNFLIHECQEGAHASLNNPPVGAHIAATLLSCITETSDLNVGRTATILSKAF